MAVTHPRQFPDFARFVDVDLQPFYPVLHTPLRSGAGQSVEVAEPYWRGTWTTARITRMEDHDGWTTWLASQRGGTRHFRAGDPSRRRPRLHPQGLGGWNGEATLASRSADTLGIDTPRPDLMLSVGDHVALRQDGKYGLHKILEAAGTNGAGFVSVTVEPPVLTNVFDTDAVVDFFDPRALFKLEPESVVAPKSAAERRAIVFSAVQVLF